MAASAVHVFCRRVLESGALEDKLAAPPRPGMDDGALDPAVEIAWPARSDELAFAERSQRLPKPRDLKDPAARARCLARFAHHELMAVELFAWALLRWPQLPQPLRRDWLHVLADEQRHCRLYLDRLAAHGSTLSEHDETAYFWRHAGAIASAPQPPLAFLSSLGLTLEQANLDFTLLYADAFRAAGDPQSARVCERVHADEIRHVRIAAHWLRTLSDDECSDDIERYERSVPEPLGAARAKGRRFDAASRAAAGLEPSFVEHVRTARSPQELRGAARSNATAAVPPPARR